VPVITDRVLDGLAAWQSRPLDPVYPVIFIDAIKVKLRDGSVANRPIYLALGVTVDGERDILGLWAGDGGEGAKSLPHVLTELQEPRRGRRVHRGRRRPAGPARRHRHRVAAGDHPDLHRALLRNSFRSASRRDWAAIAKDPRPIYTAATEAAALAALDQPLEGRPERLRHHLRWARQRRQEVALSTPVTPFA
jgi:putative transposase